MSPTFLFVSLLPTARAADNSHIFLPLDVKRKLAVQPQCLRQLFAMVSIVQLI